MKCSVTLSVHIFRFFFFFFSTDLTGGSANQEEKCEWMKKEVTYFNVLDCNCFNLFFTWNCVPEPKLHENHCCYVAFSSEYYMEMQEIYARTSAFRKFLGRCWNVRKQFERNKQIEKLTLQKILRYVCLWVGEPEKFLCWTVHSFCKTVVEISIFTSFK